MERLVRRVGAAGALGLALAALPACSGLETDGTASRAPAAEDGAALVAHEAFLDALRAGDAAAASTFLDSSPELLLFPVSGRSRLEGAGEAKAGLEAMLRGLGPAEWTVVHARPTVRPGAMWMTYLFAVETERSAEPLLGRGTEVWVRRGGEWKLAHGHWSQEPGPR
jgi:ketosteroid isomerase-like protein